MEEHGTSLSGDGYFQSCQGGSFTLVFHKERVNTGTVTTESRQRAAFTLGVPPLLQEEDLALG